MAIKDTSKDYDACIGKVAEEIKPGSLASFIDETDIPQTEEEAWKEFNHKNWKEHWVGMPSFESEDLRPVKQLIVSFKSEADMQKFANLLDQKITMKTKSIWYPEKLRAENSLKRYLENDE